MNVPHGHPCFRAEDRFNFGRIHLPVAPGCNIKCKYCVRRFDCANENRPGVTTKLLTPQQAFDVVRTVTEIDPRVSVAAVAGPGEPLANNATFETLGLVHQEFPHLNICLSTNGLLLVDKLDELQEVGLSTLTITINAVDAAIGEKVYSWVRVQEGKLYGAEAAGLLIARQMEGLKAAVQGGIAVKVNTVLMPTVNDDHVIEVAQQVGRLGAYIHNIGPLIPQGEMAQLNPPSPFELERARNACEPFIRQMRHCQQCRADAAGMIEERKRIYDLCCI